VSSVHQSANVVPGVAFPTAGPLGLSSPPSPSHFPDDRYYAPLRLPTALFGRFASRSRFRYRIYCQIRRQLAIPSSRVAPLNTCPALRPRWFPSHSPYHVEDCCLRPVGKPRLWSAMICALSIDHDHTVFGVQ
jgi:hypothetical protein